MGERDVEGKSPSYIFIQSGCSLQTLSWEVAFAVALAAAKYSPGNSHVLARDENTAPSKDISVNLQLSLCRSTLAIDSCFLLLLLLHG